MDAVRFGSAVATGVIVGSVAFFFVKVSAVAFGRAIEELAKVTTK